MEIIHKKILFVVIIVLMLLPFIQSKFDIVRLTPLDGSYHLANKPEFKWFSWNSWFNEKFQRDFNNSLEDNLGFRNLFIRINNQVDYTLYRRTKTQKAIIGKSDCLFEEGYILDYCGNNFIGKDSVNNVLKRAKWLQDYLKKEKNINLLIIYEPGKASYFPEFIPERYHPENKKLSNYHYFTRQSKALGLKFLDLNGWFMAMKDTSAYPLFPKYGVHWSTYGMYLAADTMIKFIENSCNLDLANIKFKHLKVSKENKDVDFDLELTMNLLFPLPHEYMAYPEIAIEDKNQKDKPKVLTIADSYYWSIYNSGIPLKVFKTNHFWYYFYTIYPDFADVNAKYVDQSKVKESVEKQDVILLMITELNLYRCFYGFTDKMYAIYQKEEAEHHKI